MTNAVPTHRRPLLVVALAALLLAATSALLLTACGDDDVATTTTPAATRDTLTGLTNRISGLSGAAGMVTYDFTPTVGATAQSLTLYRLSQYTRVDFGGSIFITRPDGKSYICTGASSSDGTCSEAAAGDALPAIMQLADWERFQKLFLDAHLAAEQVAVSTEPVAGQDGDCYNITAALGFDDDSRTKVCFAAKGVILSAEYDRSGGTTPSLLATQVDPDVDPAAFNPPFPVQ